MSTPAVDRRGFLRAAGLVGALPPSLTPVEEKRLHFTLDGREVAPFHEGTEDPTHVYFLRSEPTVVFGGRDCGVANRCAPTASRCWTNCGRVRPTATRPSYSRRWTA
jgi:hypothetical protein